MWIKTSLFFFSSSVPSLFFIWLCFSPHLFVPSCYLIPPLFYPRLMGVSFIFASYHHIPYSYELTSSTLSNWSPHFMLISQLVHWYSLVNWEKGEKRSWLIDVRDVCFITPWSTKSKTWILNKPCWLNNCMLQSEQKKQNSRCFEC